MRHSGKAPRVPFLSAAPLGPAVQPGNILGNLYRTSGTAYIPLIRLPFSPEFISVFIERWWYILEESPGEPQGRLSYMWVLLDHWDIVGTFLKDLAKESHLYFVFVCFMCSSSESVHLL